MRRAFPLVLVLAIAMLAVSPFLIDAAPPEATMGLVQKIFYVHFPSALLFLVMAITCGVSSGVYLLGGRRPGADRLAMAAAEMAIVLGVITLVTGPLWGRKAWGVYWVWEPRLVSTLVMWLLFSSYALVRRFGGPGSDILGAGVGVFGMGLVPFVYWSVNMWRTIHPKTSVVPTLPVSMGVPLWFMFVAMSLLVLSLVSLRMRVARLQHAVDAVYADE